MFVPMMMSMQSNNFRLHHQKESYSSYYHLTPDENGIIEHFLGIKRSQNGAQEASAPVNLTYPFQPGRPLWSNDECREGVRGKGPDGGGGGGGVDSSAMWLSCPSYLGQAEPPCLL